MPGIIPYFSCDDAGICLHPQRAAVHGDAFADRVYAGPDTGGGEPVSEESVEPSGNAGADQTNAEPVGVLRDSGIAGVSGSAEQGPAAGGGPADGSGDRQVSAFVRG